jgi:apolipoprotein N-acyltransferase
MYFQLLKILNVKPSESTIVRKLFTIQFFLGVATAFLFTSSLTMFLSNYEIKILPVAYILSACLLFVFNKIYAYLDERMTSPRLLGVVTLFSAFSILLFWVLLAFFPFKQLPLLIAGWYMLVYMLIGYAFWGLASVLFNVRESKRLFSIVGAGDIPAKMLGYFSVTALVPFIGVHIYYG